MMLIEMSMVMLDVGRAEYPPIVNHRDPFQWVPLVDKIMTAPH